MMLARINVSHRSLGAIAFGVAVLLSVAGARPSKAKAPRRTSGSRPRRYSICKSVFRTPPLRAMHRLSKS